MSLIEQYGLPRLRRDAEIQASDAGERDSPESLVWVLTREAAQTLAYLPGLPRQGYPGKSSWPDFRDDDFFAVIRERLSDGVEGERIHIRMVPSSAAITRCEIMWALWREHGFPRLGKRRELLRVVWAYAGGLRPARIRETFGVSRTRLCRAKWQGCQNVARKISWNNCNNNATVLRYPLERCA